MSEMITTRILKKLNEPGLEIDPGMFEKLIASDGALWDYFGYSLAVAGDGLTVVVGAFLDGDKGRNTGSAYIFTKQADGSYLQTQKLVAEDGAAYNYFGYSVDISADGSTVVVSTPYDDDKDTDSGTVYVFTKQSNGSYLQTQKLLAIDGAEDDYFGNSVSVSGDGSIIVAGAYGNDDKGSGSGSVYIFSKETNGSYLQIQKLVASDGEAEDYFGYSVAVSADGLIIAIGASWSDGKGAASGSVYVFTKQPDGSYLQVQKLLSTVGAGSDNFGRSVAVSGDGLTIITGASWDDEKGDYSGSAYIFTKQSDGSFLETQKLLAADGTDGDQFGRSVAVSADGSTVVVGAYGDDDKGTNSGSVYVFTKQANGSYLQSQKLTASDGAANDRFGFSVAVSNTSVVVGAFNHLNKGAVYVF